MKINDVILQSVSKLVVFIILTLALYLFFAGHHAPGGGFIGGLVLASAFVLSLLAYDIDSMRKGIPIDFKLIAATGALIVLISGFAPILFGRDFLYQTFLSVQLPVFGSVEISTVTFFELGVALTVLGVVMTIILSISEDVA